MSYDISAGLFYKTVTVTSTAHTLYIKAREVIDYDSISFDIRTSDYYMSPPADRVSNSLNSARNLGSLTSPGHVGFVDEWIEPSSDQDWFKVYVAPYASIEIRATVNNPTLDVKFVYYESDPSEWPPPWPMIEDWHGRGSGEVLQTFTWQEGYVWIVVLLGSTGGCGAYDLKVTLLS
jgi:hypothetical protein